MSSLLNNAQRAAIEGLEYASETAGGAMHSAKRGAESVKDVAERSASSVVRMALDGVSAAANIAAMLRRFELNDGLSWIGLARRRSPFVTAAAFGTGILIGTGIGFLIAPASGAETRRAMRKRFDDYVKQGARAVRRAEHEIEHEAGEIADSAAKAVEDAKKAALRSDRPNGRLTPNAMRS